MNAAAVDRLVLGAVPADEAVRGKFLAAGHLLLAVLQSMGPVVSVVFENGYVVAYLDDAYSPAVIGGGVRVRMQDALAGFLAAITTTELTLTHPRAACPSAWVRP